METIQLDLFSTNYAEPGNTTQLSSAPCEEQLAEKRNTDDCSLFLPAAGNRNNDGTMNNVGSNGNYWSSTPNDSNNAYNLNFNSGNVNATNNNNRNNGRSVRCVKAFTKESAALSIIEDSYSCRKGKGTLFGIKRLEHHIRSCSKNYFHLCYVLKMDIQGYFMNINRQRLLDDFYIVDRQYAKLRLYKKMITHYLSDNVASKENKNHK